jgi:tRNA threonylcarbamoyladenosine biosynthesis protein TsaB
VVILAFDACFGGCSVAVYRDGLCLASETVPPASGQSDRLVHMIASTLQRARFAVSDVDRVAVTLGPGGFTGVRVGVAAARALALATGKPAVATTSLHVMAAEALAQSGLAPELAAVRELVVAVDAHRGELYVQSFGANGSPHGPAHAVAVGDAAWLPKGEKLLFVGSGASVLAEAAQKHRLDVRVGLPTLLPSAQYLAKLAANLLPLPVLTPLYLRAPDAKPSIAALPSRA